MAGLGKFFLAAFNPINIFIFNRLLQVIALSFNICPLSLADFISKIF